MRTIEISVKVDVTEKPGPSGIAVGTVVHDPWEVAAERIAKSVASMIREEMRAGERVVGYGPFKATATEAA